jgi:hypothetical protein
MDLDLLQLGRWEQVLDQQTVAQCLGVPVQRPTLFGDNKSVVDDSSTTPHAFTFLKRLGGRSWKSMSCQSRVNGLTRVPALDPKHLRSKPRLGTRRNATLYGTLAWPIQQHL